MYLSGTFLVIEEAVGLGPEVVEANLREDERNIGTDEEAVACIVFS